MKNSDMKIIAIILTIALLFTVVTSNAVSIASVLFLTKTEATDAATGDGAADANNNNSNNNNNYQSNNNSYYDPNGGTVDNSGSTSDGAGNATQQGSTDAGNNQAQGNAQQGAQQGNQPQGNQPQGNQPQGNQPQGGNTGSPVDTAALKMFQDAATAIKTKGHAAYKCKAWQVIEEINVGNSVLEGIIKGFVTSEEKATVKDNAKGEDSMNRMPASNCTANAVASCSKKDSGSNVVITIVMKDQVNPTEEDKDGVALMSRDLLYMKAITNEIQNNGAIKAIVKELKTAELNYKAFTIKATMTKDGKFVEITHECHAELKAEAKLLVGSLSGDGVLAFHAKFWDFVY